MTATIAGKIDGESEQIAVRAIRVRELALLRPSARAAREYVRGAIGKAAERGMCFQRRADQQRIAVERDAAAERGTHRRIRCGEPRFLRPCRAASREYVDRAFQTICAIGADRKPIAGNRCRDAEALVGCAACRRQPRLLCPAAASVADEYIGGSGLGADRGRNERAAIHVDRGSERIAGDEILRGDAQRNRARQRRAIDDVDRAGRCVFAGRAERYARAVDGDRICHLGAVGRRRTQKDRGFHRARGRCERKRARE